LPSHGDVNFDDPTNPKLLTERKVSSDLVEEKSCGMGEVWLVREPARRHLTGVSDSLSDPSICFPGDVGHEASVERAAQRKEDVRGFRVRGFHRHVELTGGSSPGMAIADSGT
jgi:hypothetical protein